MKDFLKVTFVAACLSTFSTTPSSGKAGFSLKDSLTEFTLSYQSLDHLIILPVRINENISVNLILDTGCRNLVLFGKRFQPLFNYQYGRPVNFSGMGAGKSIEGMLSLNNSVSIGNVVGENIPVIVVKDKNITSRYDNVHGIIGYDIFSRFEIEINPMLQKITFRSSMHNYVPDGYARIPMRIDDSKPIIQSNINISDKNVPQDLLLDTGSSLELLIKSSNAEKFSAEKKQYALGAGINGAVTGVLTVTDNLSMAGFEIKNLRTGIIRSPMHNYTSIGMGALKDYLIIINYAQSYTCLKKIA